MFFPKSLIRVEIQNERDEKAIKFIERRKYEKEFDFIVCFVGDFANRV